MRPRTKPDHAETLSSLGPSKLITFRVPTPLYEQLALTASRLYQSVPTVLRAAAVEYLDRRGVPPEPAPAAFLVRFPDDEPVTPPE